MIQSVLGSIPIYFLSIFKITIKPALRLEKMMRDFSWEGKGEGKKDQLDGMWCPNLKNIRVLEWGI